MHIVIADDEPLVRIGLISMIHEMETSWEVVGEATDGEELLEMVAKYKPEAAIVDIRMPGLDGIEAICRAKAVSPRTKWIILSGYSDFQYARQALKLGVSEYLLKPVNPSDLEKAIAMISKDNKQYLQQLNQQFEYQLFSLMHGLVPWEAEPEDSLLRNGRFQGSMLYIDACASPHELEALHSKFILAVRQCMQHHVAYGVHLALIALPRGEIAAIGVWDPSKPEARSQLDSYLNAVRSVMSRFRSESAAFTLIQTEETGDFMEFQSQIGRIQELACCRVAAGMNREWAIGEMASVATLQSASFKAGKHMLQLAQEYKNKLYMNYQKTLEELESHLLKETVDMSRLQYYLQTVFPIQAGGDGEESIPVLIGQLRKIGDQLLLHKQSESQPLDLVEQVLAYMERNYMKNIGIGQIAGDLNITQSYLSTLFHKKTGTTFVKYLTRMRITKAKELLMENKLNIQQVAEQVGYYSTRHFTKLFTEIVGVYPSDFKKSILS